MKGASYSRTHCAARLALLGLLSILPAVLFAHTHGEILPDSLALRDSVLRAAAGVAPMDSLAPKPETEAVQAKAAEVKKADLTQKKGKNSTAALLWSIIPGGGQIYNEAYWKIPIVIGAYTACTYAITWNNNALSEYQNAYRDIMSDKPMENTSWQDFIPPGADPQSYVTNSSFQEQLRRGRDFYRRYRDLSIIVTVGVYLLVALDAYVDAELATFDVSPNLSLQASPAVFTPNKDLALPPDQTAGLGLRLALSF